MTIQKEGCPFCSLIIAELSFCESENFLAIYNKAPILPGHSLIIPKIHHVSFLSITVQERSEMIELSITAIKILAKVFHTSGFNWTIQEGSAAAQTIEHLHLHIIPRKEHDMPEPGDWYPKLKNHDHEMIDSFLRPSFNEDQMIKIARYIQKFNPAKKA